MEKYRLTHIAPGCWELRHPDGYWVGPGLGTFRSVADALDWLQKVLDADHRRAQVNWARANEDKLRAFLDTDNKYA